MLLNRALQLTSSFVALALLLGGESVALAKGGWSSSGGAGIACFRTQADSDAAFALIQKKFPLTDALRARVTTVEALDIWENENWLKFERVKGWKREQIVAELHEFLAQRAPLFQSRLKLAERRISLNRWKDDGEIVPIDDSNPRRNDLETNTLCRKIQLAKRTERSREGLVPEAYVSFDQVLFEKMSPLHQAALIVHELFYLFGRDYGPKQFVHKNSDAIRQLVAIFLSDNFRADLAPAPQLSEESQVVTKLINDLFGDYFLYFDREDALNEKMPAGTYNQATRHRSFGTILKKLRAQVHECPDAKPGPLTPARKACMDKVMDPRTNHKLMNEEEAFVFMTRWILDQIVPSPIDRSEHFLVFDEGSHGEPNAYQKSQLKIACEVLRDNDFPAIAELAAKAYRYCEIAGLAK